jgi:hypothetical protein
MNAIEKMRKDIRDDIEILEIGEYINAENIEDYEIFEKFMNGEMVNAEKLNSVLDQIYDMGEAEYNFKKYNKLENEGDEWLLSKYEKYGDLVLPYVGNGKIESHAYDWWEEPETNGGDDYDRAYDEAKDEWALMELA